jgi:hypothetical protein
MNTAGQFAPETEAAREVARATTFDSDEYDERDAAAATRRRQGAGRVYREVV